MLVCVDIVLPCYNPGNKWPAELENFYISVSPYFQLNFILVNDGTKTTDISQQVMLLQQKQVPITLVSYPVNRGKGFALREGVKVSNSDLIVYTDVDFPFSNHSTLKLITELAGGHCDVVAGYRNKAYYRNKMSWFRVALSKTFRWLIKHVLKISVTDTQCGIKGFNKLGKEKFLATRTNRYLFDFEFIYSVCRTKPIRVQTIEVELKDGVIFSKMKLRVLLQETVNLFYILFIREIQILRAKRNKIC